MNALDAIFPTRKHQSDIIGQDSIENLEACMRELIDVALRRRELKDITPRARSACFRRAASGTRGIESSCLQAARDYRERCVEMGAPAERYAAAPWSDLGA